MKLTAVMITGHIPERRILAKMSAKCFDLQNFIVGDRELLILNTGKSLNIRSPFVREITLNQRNLTLGDLRNIAIREAKGEYIIQWDDDDWSHPNRCIDQFEAFSDGINDCCLLTNQIRCNFLTGISFYFHNKFGIPGTILHRTDCPFEYPSWERSEDANFHEKFRHMKKIDDPNLYCRFYHGKNTWNEKHIMRNCQSDSLELKKFLNSMVFPIFNKNLVKLS